MEKILKKYNYFSTPGGNAISACELTCTLITSLSRNVVPAAISLKEGRWDRKLYAGHEISGKVLGILGLGRIGREVAIRLQAWGMKVCIVQSTNIGPLLRHQCFLQTIGFDPIVTAEEAAQFNVEKLELEQIWPVVDYITVHTPLIPQTRSKYPITELSYAVRFKMAVSGQLLNTITSNRGFGIGQLLYKCPAVAIF